MATKVIQKSSKGLTEAQLCALFTKYHREMVGRGPQEIRCHLSAGRIQIDLQGVLTKEEKNMFFFDQKGKLIQEIRQKLYQHFRYGLESDIRAVVGMPIQFLRFDIDPLSERIRVTYTTP